MEEEAMKETRGEGDGGRKTGQKRREGIGWMSIGGFARQIGAVSTADWVWVASGAA